MNDTPNSTISDEKPTPKPKTPKRSCKKCYGRGTLRVVMVDGRKGDVPCVCLKVRS